jgi:hypothetical protein
MEASALAEAKNGEYWSCFLASAILRHLNGCAEDDLRGAYQTFRRSGFVRREGLIADLPPLPKPPPAVPPPAQRSARSAVSSRRQVTRPKTPREKTPRKGRVKHLIVTGNSVRCPRCGSAHLVKQRDEWRKFMWGGRPQLIRCLGCGKKYRP